MGVSKDREEGVPSCPTLVIKSLMYGPGSPPRASKQSAVSSVTQAFPSCQGEIGARNRLGTGCA